MTLSGQGLQVRIEEMRMVQSHAVHLQFEPERIVSAATTGVKFKVFIMSISELRRRMAQNARGGLLANGSTEIPGAAAPSNQTPPNLVKDFGHKIHCR